ncbi:isoprenylcysteine carboxylmethyltransferase family protein [Candidatus Methylospira mobilis]|uniref:Isoprenylcysteine carboxylmethyltransferase family protein n=1 Tax=Candidatus Methylospira mobilis TaxID=1808979 RepID=A0A5Q0BJX4_9GAMM|nr:isoprenylcysteine carboxylmethyltransferase family protein [Candidatus Methylospira mobilis]QFY42458.1 isoprenylcysteine carboxylmethyltransferase family protein [Candidatus Methylospira mobilis]
MLLVTKILLFTALIPGMVTVFVPYQLITFTWKTSPAPQAALALPAMVIMLAGIAGYCLCVREFAVQGAGTPAPIDAPEKLVLTGLYRRTRNPMFLSILLILLAENLFFQQGVLLVYTGGVGLALHLLVLLYEEPVLRARFGPAYTAYCDAVPRWGMTALPFTADLRHD